MNYAIVFSSLLSTMTLVILLVTKKIPPASRKLIMIVIPIMFIMDSFIAYQAIQKSLHSKLEGKIAAIGNLEQYPAEAQNFAVTRACEKWQQELLKKMAETNKTETTEESRAAGVHATCTCVVSHLMNEPSFKVIDAEAGQGRDFLALVASHKEAVVKAMDSCSGD